MMTAQFQLKQQAYSSGLKSRALSILIYLIDRSNKELTCFPSIPTMAEQLHISISTVKRALHELVNCGFIKKDPRFREKNRGQTSNLYTLVMKENEESVAATTPESPANATSASTIEEKMVTEKAGQQKAHVVTHISFADIAKQDDVQETKMAADTEPMQETMSLSTQANTSLIQQRTPVQCSLFKVIFHQRIGMRHSIENLLAKVDYKFKHFLNQWTGAGVNLQPP